MRRSSWSASNQVGNIDDGSTKRTRLTGVEERSDRFSAPVNLGPTKGTTVVSTEQVEAIASLKKHEQGPEIDKAIVSLMQNGRSLAEAAAELAPFLGVAPASIQAGWYRRRRDPNAPVKHREPKAENGEALEAPTSNSRATKSGARWADFEKLINEMVEERVAERMAKIRAAIG
jgi:hypothetical protein